MNSLFGMYGRARALNRLGSMLPRLTSLPVSQQEVLVDYLQPDALPDAYQLVSDAASRGDNVGRQEYLSGEDLAEWLYYNDAVSLRDPSSGRLHGVVGVGPCYYARSVRPCLAMLTQFRSAEWGRTPGTVRDLARLGEEVARGLRYGYTGLVSPVFTACTDTYLSLRQEGFSPCAVIPTCGQLANHGINDSVILVKDIAVDEGEEFVDHDTELKRHGLSPAPLIVGTDSDEWRCLEIAGLPVDYTFTSGVKCTVRNMRADDIGALHSNFVYYGATGQGFGVDEYPRLEDTMEMVRRQYNVIFEERSTSAPVAMLNFGDAVYGRGERYVDGSAFILPEYFGARMGTEMVRALFGIAVDLGGYRGGLTDIVITNMKTLKMNQRHDYVTVGCLPRSVRMLDEGWVDALLYHVPLHDTFQSFKKILEQQGN